MNACVLLSTIPLPTPPRACAASLTGPQHLYG
jgi:hypothetical protein